MTSVPEGASMCRGRIDRQGAIPPQDGTPDPRRRLRGRGNWHSGAAAEEAVARHYTDRGGTVLERRLRTPEGEIDLIVRQGDVLVFVEVKRRAARLAESPVSGRQWQRLANAALHYMVGVQNETGVQPACRFDVALAGPDGRLRIIENARSFDER